MADRPHAFIFPPFEYLAEMTLKGMGKEIREDERCQHIFRKQKSEGFLNKAENS